jgi:hypothetical protein
MSTWQKKPIKWPPEPAPPCTKRQSRQQTAFAGGRRDWPFVVSFQRRRVR